MWLGVAGVLVGGIALGFGLAGAPPGIVLGTLATVVAIGAAVYSPALGLAVLAFSYPFDLTTYAGPMKLTTSEALLLILAIALIGRHLLRNPPPIYRTPLDIPVLLFGLATVFSLLGLTGYYSDQLVALVKAAGGFLVFFLATQSLRNVRDLWLVLTAAVSAGLVIAAEAIVPLIQGSGIAALDRASGNVIDPNLFAGYLVVLIPLALGACIALPWRGGPAAAGVATLVLGAALLATLSRGGWLGLAVGIATMTILVPGRRRVIIGISLGALAVSMIGLAGAVAARLGTGAGATPLQTLLDRLPIWAAAISMFAQHPIFGIGVNNFGNYIGLYDPSLDVNQAHNLFLNIAAERGALGIVSFGLLIVTLFVALGRALRLTGGSSQRLLVASVTGSIAALLAASLFDVAYYDYKILLLFWLVVGLGASLPRVLARSR